MISTFDCTRRFKRQQNVLNLNGFVLKKLQFYFHKYINNPKSTSFLLPK